MTNPLEPHDTHAIASDASAAPLVADLTMLYRVPVPDLRLDLREPAPAALPAATGAAAGGCRFLLRHWRPLATMSAAAAALVLFAANPAGWGGSATGVSAESILEKANAVAATNALAAGAPPYHLVATHEIDAGMISSVNCDEQGTAAGSGVVSSAGADMRVEQADGDAATCGAVGQLANTTEIWFADADHFRGTETFALSPDAAPSTFGHAVDGDNAWLYVSDADGLLVVHGPAANLGMISGLGQPNGRSLADVLSQYSGDGCQSARETGQATIAGRSAYVIEVTATPDSCALGDDAVVEMRANAESGMKLTVWVDRETYVPLKMESRGPEGELLYGYAVTEIQVGNDIPPSAFSYQPPAGTVVTEVTSPSEVEEMLAGSGWLQGHGESGVEPQTEPVGGTTQGQPATPLVP